MANFLKKIFSIRNEYKNDRKYKVLNILGLKVKKRKMSKLDKINIEKYRRELTLDEKKYYLQTQFKNRTGYNLNLDNPKTFNEKLQWLKLYDHNPLMTICADKYKVRDYVKDKIGEEYLIPLLGVWDNPDEIDFSSLPNQFVLKVNWGIGQNIIVKDKSQLNVRDAKEKLRNWLRPESNHYYPGLEWSYKNIKPKIICEEYLEQLNGDLYDYKFLCYNGIAKNLFVVSDRFRNKYIDFYDVNWERLPFTRVFNNSPKGINKPDNFDKLIQLSEKLAKPFTFVRVDFYSIENKIHFGELTFYPGNGVESFEPIEWDYKLGDLIELPNNFQ